MPIAESRCAHTCRGLCTALEIALLHEKESILQYDSLREQCTYPEVQTVLTELIIQHQKTIRLLEEAKELIREKFEVLGQVQGSFESDE